jgi:peptidoglycan hydrolase-like protein with peptidoglycan-binding domain
MRRLRFLLVLVVGSLLCAGAGYGAALTVASSSDADRPSPAGPVTARVEFRRLTSSVILRGDGRYADPAAVPLRVDAPVPVVTRTPIPVGGTVDPGDVLVEVTGRPVIALPGRLPAYRDLVVGDSGPDVVQLKQALDGLGYDAGQPDDVYTRQTAAAVATLYQRLGYRPATAADPASAGSTTAPGSTGRDAAAATLPMSEVAFVPSLPRRLDRFPARVGALLPKAPPQLSGTRLELRVDLSTSDVHVLRAGLPAIVRLPSGRSITGHLGAVRRTTTGGGTTVLLPSLGLAAQRSLQGADVKVTVPLTSTSGKALLVPLAALSTDASGVVRVERVARDGGIRAVTVRVGLSAGGYGVVRPRSGGLAAGDRVVVGR